MVAPAFILLAFIAAILSVIGGSRVFRHVIELRNDLFNAHPILSGSTGEC